MTPKEKAQELLEKFAVGGWRKEHSISCVDEIIKELVDVEFNYNLDFHSDLLLYWNDVKTEIEALS
jgi:hypothetical protein